MGRRTRTISITVSKAMVEKIDKLVRDEEEDYRSRSDFFERAARVELKKNGG